MHQCCCLVYNRKTNLPICQQSENPRWGQLNTEGTRIEIRIVNWKTYFPNHESNLFMYRKIHDAKDKSSYKLNISRYNKHQNNTRSKP